MAESLAEFFLKNFQAHRRESAYRQRRGYRTESRTYGEVLDMASGVSRELETRGIAKGDRVMLWGENSAEWVAAFFGCSLRGVVVVPMDDGSASDFAMRVYQKVSAKLLIASRPPSASRLPDIRDRHVEPGGSRAEGWPPVGQLRRMSPSFA